MSENTAKNLRNLTSDYYHGLLPKSDYRQQRAALLDAVIEGRPVATVDVTQPKPDRLPEAPQTVRARMPARSWLWLTAGACLAVLLGVIIWNAGNPGASSDSVDVQFIEDFLGQDEWAPDSIADVAARWGGMTRQDRKAALETPSFRALERELEIRIAEKRALRIAGADEGWELEKLADSLGLTHLTTARTDVDSAGSAD